MSNAEREKWDERYRERGDDIGDPSILVTAHAASLPSRGRALDLAGGAGRHALWLAARGMEVVLADISPVALATAAKFAARRGLALHTLAIDLAGAPIPAGPWQLILVFHYLQRRLLAGLADALGPDGILCVVHPTRSNLARHDKPPADFLLEDGELPGLIRGLDTIHYEEGWLAEGRHEAVLLARRPRGATE